MKNKKLAVAVREALMLGSIKQKEFALNNKIDFNDLRVQLCRNSFSFEVLLVIANLLTNSSLDELKNQFEFREIVKRKDAGLTSIQVVRHRVVNMFKSTYGDDSSNNLNTIYSHLGDSDLIVTCSINDSPFECSFDGWQVLQDSYISALRNNAVFLYVRPSQLYFSNFSKGFTYYFINPRPPEDDIYFLRQQAILSGVDEETAEQNIILYTPDFCPFWTMGMQFMFCSVKSPYDRKRGMSLFASCPIGDLSKVDTKESNGMLFTNRKSLIAFQAYLHDCFDKNSSLSYLFPRIKPYS